MSLFSFLQNIFGLQNSKKNVMQIEIFTNTQQGPYWSNGVTGGQMKCPISKISYIILITVSRSDK